MRWARKGFGLVLMNRRKGGQHGYDAEVHGQAMRMAWQAATPAQHQRQSEHCKRLAARRDRKAWESQIHTEASRRARSEKMKARWADPAYKARVGAAIAKAYSRPGMHEKIAARARTANARPEVRAKVDAARLAAWSDPAKKAKRCAAISAARKGLPYCRSSEQENRRAEGFKAFWADPERRAQAIAKQKASRAQGLS
jgi:hypothetical protein